MSLPGYATEEGTARFRKRFEGQIPAAHFRSVESLRLSSIGIGTYLGDYDSATDELYRKAVARSVELGCNVIDSAANYRFQRSERSIGAALKDLSANSFGRDEIVIATKGGYLPFDGAPPKDIRTYFRDTFVARGITDASDLVAGYHCMTPSYLLNQIDCSLGNMEISCIDVYYVHNPEAQVAEVGGSEFDSRLLKAFEALEGAVAAGKIRCYGAATWNGYRNDPGAKDYLSLAEMVEIAKKAGGEKHHFKVIQLPLNLAMPEAFSKRNQKVDEQMVSTLEAAQEFGVTVMCSASILQGRLLHNLPPVIGEVFKELETDAQRSLQFVRSTPGVTSALVGMKQTSHVEENLKVAQLPPASWDTYAKLFNTDS
jgi:aryl-alcohol dehydrogenase-like predicted oxidoreductase